MTAVDPRGRPTVSPRGRCAGCGRDYALTADGRIRWHRERQPGPRGFGPCPGARQPPASTRPATQEDPA